MDQMKSVALDFNLLKAEDVAKLFHTTQQKIKAAILNHTLPIGFVAEGSVDRIYIIDKRLEAYLQAQDLKLSGGNVKG